MSCTMLLHIVFLGLVGLVACSNGRSSCETAGCKSAQAWPDVVDGEEQEQGLKMLQMRGSKLSNVAATTQVQGLPACEVPTTPKKLAHPKSCPYQSAHAGVWGVSCLNGNTPYETLKDAWANCGKIEECGSILEAADGKYYLRRSSDPDMTEGDEAKLSSFEFQCNVRDMYFDQLRREEEDAAKQTQAQLDEEYTAKCPMPENLQASPRGKNCPEAGACLNGNKPYNHQENAWVACAQVEGCGAIMQMPDGRFFLRRLSDPDMPDAKNVRIIDFACEAVEKEHTQQEKEKFEREKKEAEMLIKAAESRCPMPTHQEIEPYGKACPPDDEKGVSCLNDNTEYPNLAEAWVACAETHECGAILQHSNGKFYLRRASDPVMPKESQSSSIKFTCASLEGQTLKEVAQADRIEELERELKEARKLQRYEACGDAGPDKESRDAKCDGNLRCARRGFDDRQFGDCADKHCCSKELLPRGVECFYFGEDIESRDAACEGNLKCARRGYENRSFGDCKFHHCCSDEENPLAEEIDFEPEEPSSVMHKSAEAAEKKAKAETATMEAELQKAKAEAAKKKAEAERAKVEAELQKARADVKAELKKAEDELKKVKLLKAEEERTQAEAAEVETVEAEVPTVDTTAKKTEAEVETVEVELPKAETRAKHKEAKFEEALERMEQDEKPQEEQKEEEEIVAPREDADPPEPAPYGEAADPVEPSPYEEDLESVEDVWKFEEEQHAADGEEYSEEPEEQKEEEDEQAEDNVYETQPENLEDIAEVPDAEEVMEQDQEDEHAFVPEETEEQKAGLSTHMPDAAEVMEQDQENNLQADGELETAEGEEEQYEEAEEEEEEEVEEEAVKAVKEAVKKAMDERKQHRPHKLQHAAKNGVHTGQFHLKDVSNHQEAAAEKKVAAKAAATDTAKAAGEKVGVEENTAKAKSAEEKAEAELFRGADAEKAAAEEVAENNVELEKAAREKAEKEFAAEEAVEKATSDKEKAVSDKAAKERAAMEIKAAEKAAKEFAEKKAIAEKAEAEKAAKEKAATEKAEKAQKAAAKKAAAEKALAKKQAAKKATKTEAAKKTATKKAESKAEAQAQRDENQVLSGYEAQYNSQLRAMFDSTADLECGWGADTWCREDNQAFINDGKHSQKDVPEDEVAETCGHICARAGEECGGFNWDVKSKSCFFRKWVNCGEKHHIGTTCYKKRMLSGL